MCCILEGIFLLGTFVLLAFFGDLILSKEYELWPRRAKSMARPLNSSNNSNIQGNCCSNCQNPLQPRYTESPEKLNLRPTQSLINPPGDVENNKNLSKKARRRRAKSEVRLNNKNKNYVVTGPPPPVVDCWFYAPCHPLSEFSANKDVLLRLNGSPYEEPRSSRALSRQRRNSRAKSRPRHYQVANNGLLTIWPGKAGVWLPQ